MRHLIDELDNRFRAVHDRSCELVRTISPVDLYSHPVTFTCEETGSCGGYIVRSAGTVERAFGGITTRLWDDPFEWTLPEQLSSPEKVLAYLEEVEATRVKGMRFLDSDAVLLQMLPAPADLRSVFAILIQALAGAEHFQGRACALHRIISNHRDHHSTGQVP